ncbi:response regulator, partial [bacterium]|nr:response regulator [bacterium]
MQLRVQGHSHSYSSQGKCSPLETSILDHAKGMERIFQFHDRLAINYPGITLLALALPLENPDQVGRLRDHLATLAEGA